jgi:2-oxoglutarate ferredoxin oxidoreductase subunit alpha
MAEKQLMAGNEAVGAAAIVAGCRHYYGYPITPQNELTAYMAKYLPEAGGTFIQSESEIAAISMVHGTGATGRCAMTSSSGPGISLKQEGISYLNGSQIPGVVVNVQRGGPGLGNIAPSQADYNQATKGGGHGDYHNIVLAPYTVQDMADITILAFNLARKWRNVVMILADGLLGQMMEPVLLPEDVEIYEDENIESWALTGTGNRKTDHMKQHIIRSLFLVDGVLEKHNEMLQEKWKKIRETEIRYEEREVEDADIICVGYGTCARAIIEAMTPLKKQGIKCGLFRPISLWPFAYDRLRELTKTTKHFLAVEMNAGQMFQDLRFAIGERAEPHFYGRLGGGVPTPEAVIEKVHEILEMK